MPLEGNVLEWWKTHQTEFPLLANLAKTYLCIPGTSVPSERVFSTAGDIVRSERSVLSAEHVDQLVFFKEKPPKGHWRTYLIIILLIVMVEWLPIHLF